MALFGEAEKGDFHTAYYCRSLADLAEHMGQPPHDSKGLYYAVQALLWQRELLFLRVQEEGYSVEDYLEGLRLLQSQKIITDLGAICLPGVGDGEIIDASVPLCDRFHSILIVTEADFYDYLTTKKSMKDEV